jgi:hypothetical protein
MLRRPTMWSAVRTTGRVICDIARDILPGLAMLSVVAVAFGLGILYIFGGLLKDACETRFRTELLSPDGNWVAIVDEFSCVSPDGRDDGSTVDVELRATQHDADAPLILSVDTTGHPEQRPRIAWTGPEALEITVQPNPDLQVWWRSYKGVTINVVSDPSVPAQ